METENFATNMEKLLNSPIKITPTERIGDGNLTPEARRKIIESIHQYISRRGSVSISDLSNQLGLSRQTVRILVNEILDKLRDAEETQILAQIQWHKGVVEKLSKTPEAFTKDQIRILQFHSSMLGKITSLQKALRKNKR